MRQNQWFFLIEPDGMNPSPEVSSGPALLFFLKLNHKEQIDYR